MAKFFTEENKGSDKPHATKPAAKKAPIFTDANAKPKGEGPREEPVPERTWIDEVGKFGMDALRNFNDTVTFGGYPALLELTGLDPNATEDLEASNPYAAILGDTAGFAIPGAGFSSGVAKAVPTLARNTIPAIIGREGVANAALSTVDNVARGDFDPVDIAADAALGGIGGGVLAGTLGLAGRAVSTGARVRGMGADLTEADRQAAKGFSDYAADKGITLNNVEAISAVAPQAAPRVQQGLKRVLAAPEGNARMARFNAAREPGMATVGEDIVDTLGGGIPPSEASAVAKDALRRNRTLVKDSAAPYYAEAEKKRLPPSWVPKDGYTGEAAREVADDAGIMKGLTLKSGGPVDPNSLLRLDAVKQKLDARAARAFGGGDPLVGGFARDEAEALTKRLDSVAPTYPIARGISEQGNAAVSALEAGPLGSVINSPTTSGQGKALFGATNDIERQASSVAARNLELDAAGNPTGVPTGVLANVLDTAVNKGGPDWAKKALPTPVSMSLADEALQRAGMEDVSGTLKAARAVDPKIGDPAPNEHTGPTGQLWSFIRDLGSGGTADKLVDPRWIERMGKMGPVQAAATRVGSGVLQSAINGPTGPGNRGKKRKKKEPIRIVVRGAGKS